MAETQVVSATLDGLVKASEKVEGILITDVGVGQMLIVETENSTYKIQTIVPSQGIVLVTGGDFFPQPETCTLSGSTWGGSVLKMRWIGLGMCMEFYREGSDKITTSPVQKISILCSSAPANVVH